MNNQLVNLIKLSETRCDHPIQCKLAYATSENFLGRIVQGYHADASHICLMAKNAADALCQVQTMLNQQQLGLFVFDGYRPLRAVRDFATWMNSPVQDEYELTRKNIHYPHLEKSQLSQLGYVAAKVSNHCYGDTIDLTLIDLNNNQLLDMGACFDFFGELSHTTATEDDIGKAAFNHRQILSTTMQQVGFKPYVKEYWHFEFQERLIDTPIDIEITAAMSESGT